MKIDGTGNVLWARHWALGGPLRYNVGGILEKGGAVYASGSIYQAAAPFLFVQSFLMRVDGGTGRLIWAKKNGPDGPALTFTDIHLYKDSMLLNSYGAAAPTGLIAVDSDGDPGSSITFVAPYPLASGKGNVLVAPDNGIYVNQPSVGPGPGRSDILLRLDSNLSIEWQYDFSGPGGLGWYQFSAAPDNGAAAIGGGIGPTGLKAVAFLKLDPQGSGCHGAQAALQTRKAPSSLAPMDWPESSSLLPAVSDLPLGLRPMAIKSRLLCPGQARWLRPVKAGRVLSASLRSGRGCKLCPALGPFMRRYGHLGIRCAFY